jgi:hypothetical protein
MKLMEVQEYIKNMGYTDVTITPTSVIFDGLTVKHSGKIESDFIVNEILGIISKMKPLKSNPKVRLDD